MKSVRAKAALACALMLAGVLVPVVLQTETTTDRFGNRGWDAALQSMRRSASMLVRLQLSPENDGMDEGGGGDGGDRQARRRLRDVVGLLQTVTNSTQRLLPVPCPNLWDDRVPLPGDAELEAGLAGALDVSSRRQVLERIVHDEGCRYCEFQQLNATTMTLSELRTLRLDKPVIIYDALPRQRGWNMSYFQHDTEYADVEVLVTELQMGQDARLTLREWLQKHDDAHEETPAGGGSEDGKRHDAKRDKTERNELYFLERSKPQSLHRYLDGINSKSNEARSKVVANVVMGKRFRRRNLPWFRGFIDDFQPVHAATEELLWSAGIPQVFPLGPWAGVTSRLKQKMRRVRDAPYSSHEQARRLEEYLDWSDQVNAINIDEYYSDIMSMSDGDFRSKWQTEDDSITRSPLFFLGPHLSGVHVHRHHAAAQVSLHGYRVWLVDLKLEMEDLPFSSPYEFFVHRYNRSDIAARPNFDKRFNGSAAFLRDRVRPGGAGCSDIEGDNDDSDSENSGNDGDGKDRRDRDAASPRPDMGFCCQPPGSMVLLPTGWNHAVMSWAEREDDGMPVSIDDDVDAITMSFSYQ